MMGIAKNMSSQAMSKCSIEDVLKSEAPCDDIQDPSSTKAAQIWQIVASIPPGKVASYGQIANLAGLPGYARFVGSTLGKLPHNTTLPWHRVVNATLRIAPRDSGRMSEQKQRLRDEGIHFHNDRIEAEHRWMG